MSSVKSVDLKNNFVLENLPIKLDKLIQTININFLKTNFIKKSDVKIGKYKLDLNSRKIILDNLSLSLTEKEVEMIIFIKSNINVTQRIQKFLGLFFKSRNSYCRNSHLQTKKKMKDKLEMMYLFKIHKKEHKINEKNPVAKTLSNRKFKPDTKPKKGKGSFKRKN